MIFASIPRQGNSESALDRIAAWISARAPDYLFARWIFLRSLGLIFLSAFYSLAFQVRGLIGDAGILPARDYLTAIRGALPGIKHLWYAPSPFWIDASDAALMAAVAAGIVCSLLLTLNIWPRLTTALCTLLFLSFIAVLQDFSSYQSDGMLLEAGVISIFFAPAGLRPGFGRGDPPTRLSLWLLRWEWFRIYFESGVVKLASGDVQWRNFTAMDQYYQNGPLPSWPGWYIQHLPHWYHALTVGITLFIELGAVWAVFLPRRFRLACFAGVTALQIGIITTANYAFLNYLVLILGVLLVDDGFGRRVFRRKEAELATASAPSAATPARRAWALGQGVALGWIFYATLWAFLAPGSASVLAAPERALEPFRFANAYGLFATMTTARYEIEFQGSNDGVRWTAYPFRYKPQDLMERPGIYAPYQPRFEWNLWFASLGPWRDSPWVFTAQKRLIEGSAPVLQLFRRDPFNGQPPSQVRTVLWRYWFTDLATKRATGAWWRRQMLGLFTGTMSRDSSGELTFTEAAPPAPP
jgi:lipase maturation factor 1